jgi:hypothetical protein
MNKNPKVLIKLIMLCSDDQWALDQRVMHRSIITGSAKCFPCLRTTVIFLQIPRTMLMAGHSSFRLSAKPFGFRRRSLSTSWIKSTILSFSPSSCSQASNALRKAIDYLKVLRRFWPLSSFSSCSTTDVVDVDSPVDGERHYQVRGPGPDSLGTIWET